MAPSGQCPSYTHINYDAHNCARSRKTAGFPRIGTISHAAYIFTNRNFEGAQFGQNTLFGKSHYGEPNYRELKKSFKKSASLFCLNI